MGLRLKKELNNKINKIKVVQKKRLLIGILLDPKFDLKDSFIEDLAMSLELSKDRFDIIIFGKNNFLKFKANSIYIEDVSLFGKFPQYLNKFLNRRFDILFNLYNKNSLLSLLSILSKANFRLGLIDTDNRLNDLIINLSPTNSKLFIEESVKYINIIFKNK